MSGSIASRYIGGVPYGPGRSVGFYPNRASVGSTPGVTSVPGVSGSYGGGDAGVVAPQIQTAGGVQVPGATSGGDGGGDNMLASVLLGLLGAAPDLYRAGKDLFGEERPAASVAGDPIYSGQYGAGTELPAGARFMDGSGSSITTLPEGARMGIDGFVEMPDGTFLDATSWQRMPVQPGELDGLIPAPTEGMVPGDGGSLVPADGAGALAGGTNWLGLPTEAVSVGDMGLGSVGGFNAGQLAYIPAAVFAHGSSTLAKPGGEMGSQIGAGLGTVIGGILGGPWGAAAGAIGGGALGGQMGAAPTIGRNFSAIGTFNGDGTIGWGNAGGDNGGEASDATGFANWFGSDLMQEAAAQGLQFNPNMSGAQFRVGGYDQFNRTAQTPGGYFYTPDTGGSPENYALRPDSSWDSAPYSGAQADAFSQNVLADLTARGVFTQAGANQPGLDFYGSSQGAPLGWYGGGAGQGSYGSDGNPLAGGFGAILGDRQGAVQGYINAQQAQGAANAGAQNVLGANFDPFAQYDPNFGWQNMEAGGPATWATDPAAMAAQQANGGA